MAKSLLDGHPELLRSIGVDSEAASIAATIALQQTRARHFEGITDFWCSFLCQRKFVYRRKTDDKAFISFGFVEFVAVGWGLEVIKHGDDTYFRSPFFTGEQESEAINNLDFLSMTGIQRLDGTGHDEEFAGISTVLCLINDF